MHIFSISYFKFAGRFMEIYVDQNRQLLIRFFSYVLFIKLFPNTNMSLIFSITCP